MIVSLPSGLGNSLSDEGQSHSMQIVNYDEMVSMRASKGVVPDFSQTKRIDDIQDPEQDYLIVREMARLDPTLATAIELTVDLVTLNGFRFTGKNKTMIKEAEKVFYDVLDFDQVIDNNISQMITFGDSYMELVRNKTGKITEVWPLETTEMRMRYNEHGTITGFVQIPDSSQGVEPLQKKQHVTWEPDEVLHFRMKWVGARVYSDTPFLPIANSFSTKTYANNYLQQLFRNIPPKVLYGLKNASKAERELFAQRLMHAKTNPALDLIGFGDVDSKLLQLNFDSGLIEVLRYIRNEVLSILRVPMHWLPDSGGSSPNKGIGENVLIPYETKIRKIQMKIASVINRTLMPMLGFDKIKFQWNPISLMDEKSMMQVAQIMKSVGIEDDAIMEYIQSKGMKIPADAKIIPPPMPMMGGPQLQKDGAPSRQRNNPGTDKVTSNLDRKGVSEAGTKKMEEQKMQTRSTKTFNEWPYIMTEAENA